MLLREAMNFVKSNTKNLDDMHNISGGSIKNAQVSARNILDSNYYLYLCNSKLGKVWILSIILAR